MIYIIWKWRIGKRNTWIRENESKEWLDSTSSYIWKWNKGKKMNRQIDKLTFMSLYENETKKNEVAEKTKWIDK